MVSIHAPAWGATDAVGRLLGHGHVSIHAPAWGATTDYRAAGWRIDVSIHAPAWGATSKVVPAAARSGGFNPRARVGRDQRVLRTKLGVVVFQSTRPRGARRCAVPESLGSFRFQSTRPRGARRQTVGIVEMGSDVSIHAPAWGATNAWQTGAHIPRSFNPRARVGRDRMHSERLVR